MSQTVVKKVHFQRGERSRREIRVGEVDAKKSPPGRIPRLAKLMALAIQIEEMVRDGLIADYAEAATLGYVSRARMTQIMNLLHLAPDIQEEILSLPRVENGRDPITERVVRGIVAEADWGKQREMWHGMALLA